MAIRRRPRVGRYRSSRCTAVRVSTRPAADVPCAIRPQRSPRFRSATSPCRVPSGVIFPMPDAANDQTLCVVPAQRRRPGEASRNPLRFRSRHLGTGGDVVGEPVPGSAVDDQLPVRLGVVHLAGEAGDVGERDVRIRCTVADESRRGDRSRFDGAGGLEAPVHPGHAGDRAAAAGVAPAHSPSIVERVSPELDRRRALAPSVSFTAGPGAISRPG